MNRGTFPKRKVTRNYKLVNCEFPKAKAAALAALLKGPARGHGAFMAGGMGPLAGPLSPHKETDTSRKNWVN